MVSSTQLSVLVIGMLFTGTINTILNKFQDLVCVSNCKNDDKSTHTHFEQPLFQTLNMFIGEVACLFVYYLSIYLSTKSEQVVNDELSPLLAPLEEQKPVLEGWKNLLFWIPTLCDLTATTLMNVGLIYTSASIYQMLRGGIFSVLFLKKKHPMYRWFALVLVFLGVSIVGSSSILQPDSSSMTTSGPIKIQASFIGVAMVVLAQVFTAFQFVIEEKILLKYNTDPLKAVGLEGLFGILSLLILIPPAYLIWGINGQKGGFLDIPTAFQQVFQNNQILYAGVGIIFSIAFFNWFGLSVTRRVSATSRSTIDTCRTIFIWMTSLILLFFFFYLLGLGLGWESFKSLQVLGFIVLLFGTLIFNDVIPAPSFCRPGGSSGVVVEGEYEEIID